MKTKTSLGWLFVLLMIFGFFLVACGDSKKKDEKVKEQKQTVLPADTVTVIETETVIEVDSITTDSTAGK